MSIYRVYIESALKFADAIAQAARFGSTTKVVARPYKHAAEAGSNTPHWMQINYTHICGIALPRCCLLNNFA